MTDRRYEDFVRSPGPEKRIITRRRAAALGASILAAALVGIGWGRNAPPSGQVRSVGDQGGAGGEGQSFPTLPEAAAARTPERFAPLSQDRISLIPVEFGDLIRKEGWKVRPLEAQIDPQNFKVTAEEAADLSVPEVREVTTPTGRIIEVAIDEDFLLKAGAFSRLLVGVDKTSARRGFGPASKGIELSQEEAARIYNAQIEHGPRGKIVFYVNEAGLGGKKYKPGSNQELLGNVIDVEPDFAAGRDYDMNFHFENSEGGLTRDMFGRMEVSVPTGRPNLAVSFSR